MKGSFANLRSVMVTLVLLVDRSAAIGGGAPTNYFTPGRTAVPGARAVTDANAGASRADNFSLLLTNSIGSGADPKARLRVSLAVPQFSSVTNAGLLTEPGESQASLWGDYDNDGCPDLFVPRRYNQYGGLYRNNQNGTFTKITTGSVVDHTASAWGAIWGDYDNDGHLDLFVRNDAANNSLYRNNGDGTFTQIAEGPLVSEGGNCYGGGGCAWGDYDNDGHLDLFVCNRGANNALYHNQGNGTFVKVTQGEIVNDAGDFIGCAWGDYNNDGYLDLFVTGGAERHNYLYRNNGDGTFTRVPGGDLAVDAGNFTVGTWADYDNDGYLDLFIPCHTGGPSLLYHNNGDSTFTKIPADRFPSVVSPAVGCAWGDYDNDGYLDLFVANAYNEANLLYHNLGNGTFEKMAADWLVTDAGMCSGGSWVDYDGDGRLDLFVTHAENQNSFLYHNEGMMGNWLRVKCVGTKSTHSGIGAKITIWGTQNGVTLQQSRELASYMFGSSGQSGLEAFFGLGSGSNLDVVRVEWSSGVVQVLTNIAGNQFLTVTEETQPAVLPSLSISDAAVTESDMGTVDAVFTVWLSAPSSQPVTVDFSTAADSAQGSLDYVFAQGTLTFNPGETNRTLVVPVLGDTLPEADETFFVNLSTPSNATLADDQGVCTIADNDPWPLISITDESATEGNSGTVEMGFTVSLSRVSGQPVTVDFFTTNTTATAGSDYVATNGTLVFNPGETNKTILLTISGDVLAEGDETFFVMLANATSADIGDGVGIGTIVDDDTVAIAINDVSVVEENSGATNAVFAVSLSGPGAQVVKVDYATAGDTATSGVDFTAASGTLTFNPGETNKVITVSVVGDTLDEVDERFVVVLSNAVNAGIGRGQGIGTIMDDDTVTLSINDVSVVEGNGGATNAVFAVSLSGPGAQVVKVDYATAGDTATSGVDFTAASGTLTFDPGETNKVITVSVVGDTLDELDERFAVVLSNAVNAGITRGQGIGTIVDDDPAPTLSISDKVVVEGNSGTTNAVFTVRLSAASGQPVVVDFFTTDGTATAGSDYLATNGTLHFPPGALTQALSVLILGDAVYEPDETFSVNLANATNVDRITRSQARSTIMNDDSKPTLSITDAVVREGDSAMTNALFTVLLSLASREVVTVDYFTIAGTAAVGSDYLATNGTLRFSPGDTGKSISVVVWGDTLRETNETFLVCLTNCSANADISQRQGVGTILDDDANVPPTVTLTSPADRAVFPSDTNVVIEAATSDWDGAVSRVDFYVGSTHLGTATGRPYRFTWENVLVGDYTLTAKATDDQGATATSAPVTIVVSGMTGDVAIVGNGVDPEIQTLQDCLFEMGLSSRVLAQEGLTAEALQRFQLIIWDDLGKRGLLGSTIRLFHRSYTNGIPLYLIGDELLSANEDVAAEEWALWTNLLHVVAASGTAAPGMIAVNPVTAPHCLLNGRFGAPVDFGYSNQVALATAALDAEVFGRGTGGDVLVAYPTLEVAEGDWEQVRSFTQTCRVTTGGDGASMEERKELFQNAVTWLLKQCRACSTLRVTLEMQGPEGTVRVGSPMTYELRVLHGGECEGVGVVVTNRVAPTVQFVAAESKRGRVRHEGDTVTFELGHMTSAESAELRLTVIPMVPGELINGAGVRAVNAVFDERSVAWATNLVEGPAMLRLESANQGRYELRLAGNEGMAYEIQATTDFLNWAPVTNAVGAAWSMPLADPLNPAFRQRFYRAKGQ